MKHIILTAGHNENDSGAVSPATGLKEADYVAQLVPLVARKLKPIAKVTTDTPQLSFLETVRLCRDHATTESLVLDLHLNAAMDKSVRGTEAIVRRYNGNEKTARLASRIADTVATYVPTQLRRQRRLGQPAPYPGTMHHGESFRRSLFLFEGVETVSQDASEILVLRMQQRLNRLLETDRRYGFMYPSAKHIAEDGIYGPQTAQAVQRLGEIPGHVILLEIGFLSCPSEEQNLLNNRVPIAEAIARAVRIFYLAK